MSTVHCNDLLRRHNVSIIGDGDKTLMFAHGFGCNQEIWQQIIPAFYKDYRIVLFDYMGCGKSDMRAYDKQQYSNLQAYADDLVAICEALNTKDIYLIGHSVSGSIAMLVAIEHPDLFQQIIAISPSPRYLNDLPDYVGGFNASDIKQMLDMMDRNYFEWSEYLPPVVVGQDQDDSVNELKQHFLKTDPEICKEFARVTFDLDIRQQLSKVPVPVCVLYCLEDVVVPLEVVEYLARHIPNCNAIELNASGHYPQLTNPLAVVDAIQQEIKSAA